MTKEDTITKIQYGELEINDVIRRQIRLSINEFPSIKVSIKNKFTPEKLIMIPTCKIKI